MNITEIEDALHAWVYGQAGITTIFGFQPTAVRPTTSYAVINVFATGSLGTKETVSTALPDGSIDNVYSSQKEFTASINIYYSGAYEIAEALRNSLDKVAVADSLWESGIGLKGATEVQRVPNVMDEEWEERGQFDISFHYRSEVTENVETIQNIEITNDIDDYETTITLTPIPVMTNAVISAPGTTIQLLFSEAVTFGAGGDSGWSLGTPTATMTYVSGDGSNILVYSLSETIGESDTPTVSYVQPGNGVESQLGKDLDSLTDISVENNIQVGLLFENDFTGDPLGSYDPVNSDYIAPGLSVESLIFGDLINGVITEDGYETTFLSAITFTPAADPSAISTRFMFKDSGSAYWVLNKLSIATNEGMGVLFDAGVSGVTIQAAFYPGVLNELIISGPPSSWINKEIMCETTLTGDSLNITVTYESSVIYANTVIVPVEGNDQASMLIDGAGDVAVQYFSLT